MCKFNRCCLKFIQTILAIISLLSFVSSFIMMCLYIGVYNHEYIKNVNFFGELSIYILLVSLYSYNMYTQIKNKIYKNLTNITPTNMEDDDYD